MKLKFSHLKIRKDLERFEIYHWGVFFFLFLAGFYRYVTSGMWFTLIVYTLVLVGYSLLVRKLLRGLYYSFWPFLGLLFIYTLIEFCSTAFLSTSSLLYLMALILMIVKAYTMWTPIFYPIVSWWEYDFRYRDDLKVRINFESDEVEARLTDLRRSAGCIASFKNLDVGSVVSIEPFEDYENIQFKAEIMSKRKYSLGRPFNYGVRFILDESHDSSVFKQFCLFWKNERKSKLTKKFKSEES